MKEIAKAYEASKYEDRIYKIWEESGEFAPVGDKKKEPFTIMMPPPNATGTLHLGHATMLALEDTMVRYKRMDGFDTLWIPGTDHAGIATQSVVEKKLQTEGIKNPREELGREKLLVEIEKFVDKSKGTIRNQIKKMGSSCDWTRERYTFSKEMNLAVNELFKMMYADELIYRGGRIVNWDPKMQTTIADDEMEYVEEKAPFYTFKYGPFEISTSRPETKFGDKYVVMHPDDKRYKKYKHGEKFECEWINGKITATIIKDKAVDPEFGTGVMTITPWHDLADFEISQRHDLEKQQIIGFDGKLLGLAGEFAGMKILEARPKIVEKLKDKGLLVKVDENYIHNVAQNYRGKGLIEPQIMEQWFININKKIIDWHGKKLSIKEVLQTVVKKGEIKIIPENFEKIYFHWIDNLRDWCISRQIWWGHRIPVWYCIGDEACKVECKKPTFSSEILKKCPHCGSSNIKQDEDSLDTWFSSSIWTFSTLGWPEKTPDLMRYTPSDVLETGYDILFFWVARMILSSTYALRKSGFSEEMSIPFKNVYLHGLIRDIRGKKMSKSNPETCIDPLDMISKYGTDAVRLSLMIGSSAGNDMRLYEKKIAGYRNFVNKIWNGSRFVLMNLDEEENENSQDSFKEKNLSRADKWILTRLNEIIEKVTKSLDNYQFSEAGITIYDFFWGDYCDWYVEMSKVKKNAAVLKHVLETSLKLMHPFMPFVTEAIWAELNSTLLISETWPEPNKKFNYESESEELEIIIEVVTAIRSLRAEGNVDATKKIHAIIYAHEDLKLVEEKAEIIKRLANLGKLEIMETGEKVEKSLSTFVRDIEIYLPLADMLDFATEKIRTEKEIENLEKYMTSLDSKLKNPGFSKNAKPEVIELEKQKWKDAELKCKKMKEYLKSL